MKRRALLLLGITLVSLVVNVSLFWFFEQQLPDGSSRTLLDVVYWWVATSATVGYGDVVPMTPAGKLVTIFTVMTGFCIFTSLVAVMVESMHEYIDRKARGRITVRSRHHIVLCEYTAIADELIQSLPSCPAFVGKDVVVVSDLVQHNPYPHLQFVNGVPINPAVLRQANVMQAEFVFVFANLRFADPDVKTLHIASRVLALNPDATVFVELVDPSTDLLTHTRGRLVVMESRELIARVLRGDGVDPSVWLANVPQEGSS